VIYAIMIYLLIGTVLGIYLDRMAMSPDRKGETFDWYRKNPQTKPLFLFVMTFFWAPLIAYTCLIATTEE